MAGYAGKNHSGKFHPGRCLFNYSEMNGEHFTLPMEMLDKKSMHQAFIFSQHSKSNEAMPHRSAVRTGNSINSDSSNENPSPVNKNEVQLLAPNTSVQNKDANITFDIFQGAAMDKHRGQASRSIFYRSS